MKRSASLLATAAATLFGAMLAYGAASVGQSAPDFKVRD